MAIETFTWHLQIQAQGAISYNQRTRKAQFGDGYSQIAGDGINPETLQVPITWSGSLDTAREIRDFLRNHVSKSFIFTPPFESKGLYRADGDSIKFQPLSSKVATVTATLTQAYAP